MGGLPLSSVGRAADFNQPNRVGEAVTGFTSHTTVRAVRHTAVPNESSNPSMQIEQAYESSLYQERDGNAGVHMRSAGVPPRTSSITGRSPCAFSVKPK